MKSECHLYTHICIYIHTNIYRHIHEYTYLSVHTQRDIRELNPLHYIYTHTNMLSL